ncbi:GNAT family N-acetyltransferase [Lactiplantibacillus herbarum]|uniref:GNAT family N-acetyltransferase n=1 Tax=Lactiplantibacillus herbarum TaxID=1670446 RepID=UPI00064FC93A|nr:GNAT family N-acetyltransferase [Lactiplantibacillus herbarum]
MNIREYRATDLDRVIQLFEETVSRINVQDYSSEQLVAWIGHPDRTKWQSSLLAHITYVMVSNEVLVGFADMTANGYLDRLYVGADYQGLGIATALVTALEEAIPVKRYATEASITARPFFESRGYQTIKQNVVIRNGIELTNFTMVKKAIK